MDGLEDGGILRDFRGLRYNVRRKDFRWTGGWRLTRGLEYGDVVEQGKDLWMDWRMEMQRSWEGLMDGLEDGVVLGD